MTQEEIKLRQLTNQYLITPSYRLRVVRDLCGIQAQFLGNALHSLKIRCLDYDEDAIRRELIKNWTLRGTVHVFAKEDLPVFLHCNDGRDYRKNEWKGYTFWNQREKWALTPKRQQFFSDVIMNALEEGPRTRDELKEVCRDNGMTGPEEDSMFDQWGGGIRELCERGFMNYVVQEKKVFCLTPEFVPMPEEAAKLEIARRYFTNMGPATVHDAMYFLRATAAEVKGWLSVLPVKNTECGGRTYYYIENGKSYDNHVPHCIFLAGFDQLMLGYEKKESLYIKPENMRAIFNLAGIVMPALMLKGEVAGKWKKKNRKLTVWLFGRPDKEDLKAVEETAGRLWEDVSAIEYAQ